MTVLKWEEPRESRGNKPTIVLDSIVAELQQRPGHWALVKDNHHRLNWEALSKRGAEITARSNPDKTYRIYARWPNE